MSKGISTSALAKYLDRYAEPEAQLLEGFPNGFKQGLVIPLYRESLNCLNRFSQFAEAHTATLTILVLNRPESDQDSDWARLWLQQLSLNQTEVWQSSDQLQRLFALNNQSALLVIDRCINGKPLPDDQGVGLARKIGADMLCALIQQGKVQSPWISNTDADALLPEDYFQPQHAHSKKCSALVYPFEHIFIDDTPQLPTLLYEFSLHYYVAGLAWAGSPYSYQTVGSIIAVNYQHYAMVRGFPKRAGAEDFYLLNKLAKTAPIQSLNQPTIKLQARESSRVPFGTGPAVINLAALEDPLSMPLYNPECFVYLRFFIQLLEYLADNMTNLSDGAEQLLECQKISSTQTSASIDAHQLLLLAKTLKLEPALQHSYQHGKDKSSRLKHLHQWFDGFKTLKFIHTLRDQYLANISYRQWSENSYPVSSTQQMQAIANKIKSLC